jgi:hypothetical protein
VNRFKAAGFAVEVASWLGVPDPAPLSGQEVEQTLGSDVICGIANKIGLSQRFARTILGYAMPKIIVLRAQDGAIPSAIRASASSFLESAIPLSSSPVEEITQPGAEQIRPSRTEHGGPAPVLGGLVIPGAALLITLGLLLGYFIGAAIVGQSSPRRLLRKMRQCHPLRGRRRCLKEMPLLSGERVLMQTATGS